MATVNRHDAARNQICRWCCAQVGGKGRIATLTGQTRVQYIKHFEPIDDSDNYRPLVVCVSCKLYLGNLREVAHQRSFTQDFRGQPCLQPDLTAGIIRKLTIMEERCALCVQKKHDLVHAKKHRKLFVILMSDGPSPQAYLSNN